MKKDKIKFIPCDEKTLTYGVKSMTKVDKYTYDLIIKKRSAYNRKNGLQSKQQNKISKRK